MNEYSAYVTTVIDGDTFKTSNQTIRIPPFLRRGRRKRHLGGTKIYGVFEMAHRRKAS